MKVDYETRCAYNALTEEQKQQLPRIHRKAMLPALFVYIPVAIYAIIGLVDAFVLVFGNHSVFKTAQMFSDLLKTLLFAGVGNLIAFLIHKLSIACVKQKYPFYTERLGNYAVQLAKKNGGRIPVGAPSAKAPARSPDGALICPRCGQKQDGERSECFYCLLPFAQPKVPVAESAPIAAAKSPQRAVGERVNCPQCGAEQPANRKVCFYCGVLFEETSAQEKDSPAE